MDSNLDRLVRKFTESDQDSESNYPLVVITCRLPLDDVELIDSLARHSGLSRASMLREVFDLGARHLLANLPGELAAEIVHDARAKDEEAA
jgi:hypothetical protein